jgi:hypothetical protein
MVGRPVNTKELHSVKMLILFLLLILTVTNGVSASPISNELLPPCQLPACYAVAERKVIKETVQTRGVKVSSPLFVVTIPPNVTGIDHLSTVTVYHYGSGHNSDVIIGTETAKDLPIAELKSKPSSVSDFLDVIFTRLPKDREVSGDYDKVSWNALMWLKKLFIGQSGLAQIYEKAGLKIYYISNAGIPFDNVAWAVNQGDSGIALKLQSNINRADFEEILFTISPHKTGK